MTHGPGKKTEIEHFSKIVQSLVTLLSEQSQKIERAKLQAIGQRNRIESETENRKRKQSELNFMTAQAQAELQRAVDEYESLVKVEKEQQAIIERLSKS